jgi:hypothetical protein
MFNGRIGNNLVKLCIYHNLPDKLEAISADIAAGAFAGAGCFGISDSGRS